MWERKTLRYRSEIFAITIVSIASIRYIRNTDAEELATNSIRSRAQKKYRSQDTIRGPKGRSTKVILRRDIKRNIILESDCLHLVSFLVSAPPLPPPPAWVSSPPAVEANTSINLPKFTNPQQNFRSQQKNNIQLIRARTWKENSTHPSEAHKAYNKSTVIPQHLQLWAISRLEGARETHSITFFHLDFSFTVHLARKYYLLTAEVPNVVAKLLKRLLSTFPRDVKKQFNSYEKNWGVSNRKATHIVVVGELF